MNFVSTRNSTDNVPPFTKFYYEVLDHKKYSRSVSVPTDKQPTPRSNLRPLDSRVVTVAGVALSTRGASTTGGVPPSENAFRSTIEGAIESLSPTYWHAPTHPNSPSTSSLPALPASLLPVRNLASEMGGVSYAHFFHTDV